MTRTEMVSKLPPLKRFEEVKNAAPTIPISLVLLIYPITYWAQQLHNVTSKNKIKIEKFGDSEEEGLNNLYEFWASSKESTARISRFATAVQSPHIPELELKEIVPIANRKNKLLTSVQDSIVIFLSEGKKNWKLVEKAMNSATQYNNETDSPSEDQMIALCEAIATVSEERMDSPLSPIFMRQLIAQHAFTELFTEGKPYKSIYRQLEEDNPNTMQDQLEIEKNELIAALHSKGWDHTTIERNKKIYENERQEYETNNDGLNGLDLLWKCTNGKALDKTSALKILQTQEVVYDSL